MRTVITMENGDEDKNSRIGDVIVIVRSISTLGGRRPMCHQQLSLLSCPSPSGLHSGGIDLTELS